MSVLAKNWVIAALSLALWAVAANAQNRFVQITDPHIFDADQPAREEALSESQQLSAAFSQISMGKAEPGSRSRRKNLKLATEFTEKISSLSPLCALWQK